MRTRHILGSIVFVTFACTAIGCGSSDDGTGEENPTDSGVHPDSHVSDTSTDAPKDSGGFDVGDTGSEGATDSGKADSGVDAHDSAVDSTTDSGTTDSTTTDSTATDTTATDTTATDTTATDTTATDTTVDDTTVADTTVDDTATADTADAATDVTSDATDATDTADAGSGLPAQIVWVVRVGDGTAALSSTSTAAFVDKYRLSDGTLLGSIALPTAAAGSNNPFTLAGTGTSEGALALSMNGKYATLAGYATGPGKAAVNGTSTTTTTGGGPVLRVAARIDAAETVDTSTTTTSNSGSSVRAAVTNDGTAFWMSGGATGVYYQAFGGSGAATTISTGLSNARVVNIFGSALYGTSGSSTFRIFDFGGTLPTTATAPTDLPGTPNVSGDPESPYGIVGLALHGATIDTIYVCDDRAPTNGGVQRWTVSGGTWSLSTTFNDSITAGGCRGLTAFSDGTNVYLVATTGENPSRLVVYVDTVAGLTTATAITVASSSTTTGTAFFRGVSLPPSP